MGGYPKSADAKKAIRKLEDEFDWVYDTGVGNSSHTVGMLACSGSCRLPVYGTSNNAAMGIWRQARKCRHGHAPDRVKP